MGIICSFIFIFFSIVPWAKSQKVSYEITTSSKEIIVDMRYAPDKNVTWIEMPRYGKVKIVANKNIKNTKTPYIKKVLTNGQKQVHLTYSIEPINSSWKPTDHPNPWIEKNLFQIEGKALFAYPVNANEREFDISIHWNSQGLVANSFGINTKDQQIKTSLWNLKKSIFLGGTKLHFDKISVNNKPVYIVSDQNNQSRYESMKSIISTQRQMYNDYNFPHYLVVILGNSQKWGLAFNGAACLYLPKGDVKDFDWFFAHEHFHIWNGYRISTLNSSENLTWFTEGFTEYYANITNLKAGVYDQKTFVRKVNATISEYHNSRVKNDSYDKTIAKKYDNLASRRLPYLKGHLFALHLDNEIRMSSNGRYALDNVMKDLYKQVYQQKKVLSTRLIKNTVHKYYKKSLKKELDLYVHSGKTIPADKKAWFSDQITLENNIPYYS